jgi:hypothetical protein
MGALKWIAMKFILVTRDAALVEEARNGFHPGDTFESYEDWSAALDACQGADLIFVDQIATLDDPHKVAGYERFAEAKMAHAIAAKTPLVLISPPEDYEMDFITGWPNFVFANMRRPVTFKQFRRASTWV